MRTMLLSAVFALLLATSVLGQAGKSVDDLIGEVFSNPEQGGDNAGGGNQDYTGAEGDCECVPYYLCQNNSIITDGVGLIDIRLGPISPPSRPNANKTGKGIKDGPCENYLDVCCNKPNQLKPENPITPEPHTRTGCGQRNPEGVGFRITGDKDGEAQYGEFPWMVALLREEAVDGSDQRLNVYQCGGSLIHPKVVLTSAHCVAKKSPQELKIRAGEWDTQTKNELFPHQDRLVSKVIIHDGYYAGALYNDIALLILHEPVAAAENVDVVCLPKQGQILDHSRCFASGWGKDVFGKEGRYQVILKKVELPIVPRPNCLEALRKTRLGPYFKLHESFICAGGEAKRDTCKGDGGSPLVCPLLNDPLHYQQAGIVAWGIGCGEDRTPGVYANVALFRNWIDQKMQQNNLDTHSYTY